MEQIACLAYLSFLKEAFDDFVIRHHVGGASQLGHPARQHAQSLICPIRVAKSLLEGAEDDPARPQARPEVTGKEGERQVRAARAAAAVHEDAIGAGCGRRHPWADALGDAGVGRPRAGDGDKKVVQGGARPPEWPAASICRTSGVRPSR